MRKVACTTFAIFLVPTIGIAADEDWSRLYACFDANLAAMEVAEPSIQAGAAILVDAICTEQATDLGNSMLETRKSVVDQKGFGEAFSSFLYVMKREATVRLFEARRARLGI